MADHVRHDVLIDSGLLQRCSAQALAGMKCKAIQRGELVHALDNRSSHATQLNDVGAE